MHCCVFGTNHGGKVRFKRIGRFSVVNDRGEVLKRIARFVLFGRKRYDFSFLTDFIILGTVLELAQCRIRIALLTQIKPKAFYLFILFWNRKEGIITES